MLQKVFHEEAHLGEVPVIITGDFNIQAEESEVVQKELDSARWYDVAAQYMGQEKPCTYSMKGIVEGEDLPGSSCIDLIFANRQAMALIVGYKARYDAPCPKHLAQELEIRLGDYDPEGRI